MWLRPRVNIACASLVFVAAALRGGCVVAGAAVTLDTTEVFVLAALEVMCVIVWLALLRVVLCFASVARSSCYSCSCCWKTFEF